MIKKLFKIEKFDLLVAIYIFCVAVAEIMGAKTFPLFKIFGFQLSASLAIFVVPLIFTINDMITEVFGKERARSVIRSGLIVIFLILVSSVSFTLLPPTQRFAPFESAFDVIFSKSARIAFASLTAFAIAEFLDVYVFYRIRQAFGQKALWFRTNASNFISQFVDTIIFMTLAFYAFDKTFLDNFTFLSGLIIPWWLIKSSMSVIETPFVYIGVKWLKEK